MCNDANLRYQKSNRVSVYLQNRIIPIDVVRDAEMLRHITHPESTFSLDLKCTNLFISQPYLNRRLRRWSACVNGYIRCLPCDAWERVTESQQTDGPSGQTCRILVALVRHLSRGTWQGDVGRESIPPTFKAQLGGKTPVLNSDGNLRMPCARARAIHQGGYDECLSSPAVRTTALSDGVT